MRSVVVLRSRRAEEGEELTVRAVEVQPVDGHHAAEALGEGA